MAELPQDALRVLVNVGLDVLAQTPPRRRSAVLIISTIERRTIAAAVDCALRFLDAEARA
jgi:hypothetical protein